MSPNTLPLCIWSSSFSLNNILHDPREGALLRFISSIFSFFTAYIVCFCTTTEKLSHLHGSCLPFCTNISPVSPVSKLFEIWQPSWQDTRFFSAKTSIKRGRDLVMTKMGPTTITKPLQKGVFEALLGCNTLLLTKFSVIKFWVARNERKFQWKPRQLWLFLPAAVFTSWIVPFSVKFADFKPFSSWKGYDTPLPYFLPNTVTVWEGPNSPAFYGTI